MHQSLRIFVLSFLLLSIHVFVHAYLPNTIIATISGFDGPYQVAITPNGKFAYVTNNNVNSVSVIDIATNTISTTIPGFTHPAGIAITPNGLYAYVVNNTTVSVIDLNPLNPTYNTIIHTINGPFNIADGIAITPDGNYAYVADTNSHSVKVINIATNSVLTTPALDGVFSKPQFIAITPDSRYAYVTNSSTHFPPPPVVDVIDIATNTLYTAISGFNDPEGIIATPDGKYVYVADSLSGSIVVIDTATNSKVAAPNLHGTVPAAFNLAITADGNYIYTANGAFLSPPTFYVSVINALNNTIIPAPGLNTGQYPQGIAITPHDQYVYVADIGNNTVEVIYTGISTAPTNFSGCKRKNTFLTQLDTYNHLTWSAPTNGNAPVQYNLYRDAGLTQLVATVPASGILQYDDHNRNPNVDYTYYMVAVDAAGDISLPAVTTVTEYC